MADFSPVHFASVARRWRLEIVDNSVARIADNYLADPVDIVHNEGLPIVYMVKESAPIYAVDNLCIFRENAYSRAIPSD